MTIDTQEAECLASLVLFEEEDVSWGAKGWRGLDYYLPDVDETITFDRLVVQIQRGERVCRQDVAMGWVAELRQ